MARGFDAGIRFEENLAQDMVAIPLSGPQRYAVVASPDFLAANGTPTDPRDLLGQPCIMTRFPNGVVLPWELERDGETVKILPKGRLISLNLRLNIRAAIDGLGFHATFEGNVRDHIKAGRLVSVLDDWCQEFSGPTFIIRAGASLRRHFAHSWTSYANGENRRCGEPVF